MRDHLRRGLVFLFGALDLRRSPHKRGFRIYDRGVLRLGQLKLPFSRRNFRFQLGDRAAGGILVEKLPSHLVKLGDHFFHVNGLVRGAEYVLDRRRHARGVRFVRPELAYENRVHENILGHSEEIFSRFAVHLDDRARAEIDRHRALPDGRAVRAVRDDERSLDTVTPLTRGEIQLARGAARIPVHESLSLRDRDSVAAAP